MVRGAILSILALAAAACGAPENRTPDDASRAGAILTPGGRHDLNAIARRTGARPGPAAIRLGPGDYRLSATLALPSGSVLSGAGQGVTRILADGPMEAMLANAAGEAGDSHITVQGVTLDCDGRARRGARFYRVADLTLTDVELTGCLAEGLRISGRGRPTRGLSVVNVNAHHNRGDGLIFMWAVRSARYVNLTASFNGGRGVYFDHSEFQAANVTACDNGGNGIHLRNFFAGNLDGLYACRNGRNGVFVQGMVGSTGAGWIAQANSRSAPGAFDDVYFSAADTLSYGATRNSVISGIAAGAYADGYGQPSSRYGVYVEAGATPDLSGLAFEATLAGTICQDCSPPAY